MCLLILNSSKPISREQLYNAWENNSDGGGMSFVDGKELVIQKYDDFNEFYQDYQEIRRETSKPMILHFRITSSGSASFDNIHPFFITQGKVAMGHNGTISSLGDSVTSDTRHLANLLSEFKGTSVSIVRHVGVAGMIRAIIGGYNKLVFLDRHGDFEIFNEHLGHWTAQGDWMSNDSYKKVNNYVYRGNEKVYKGYSGSATKHYGTSANTGFYKDTQVKNIK